MKKTAQHVVPNPDGGWSVKKSGSTKATKTFSSQSDASKFGSQIAKNQKTEIIMHSKDGRIQSVKSFSTSASNQKKGAKK